MGCPGQPGGSVWWQLDTELWGSEKPAKRDTFGGRGHEAGIGSCGLYELMEIATLSAMAQDPLLVPTYWPSETVRAS